MKKVIFSAAFMALIASSFMACSSSSGSKAKLVSEFSADFETYKKQRLECDKVIFLQTGFFGSGIYMHKEVEPILEKIKKKSEEYNDKIEAATISHDGDKVVKLRKQRDKWAEEQDKETEAYKLTDEETANYKKTCVKDKGYAVFLASQEEYDLYKKGLESGELDKFRPAAEYQELINTLRNREKEAKEAAK